MDTASHPYPRMSTVLECQALNACPRDDCLNAKGGEHGAGRALTSEGQVWLLLALRALHHLHNGQAILLRKFVVARVVCGHGHDGATAVAAQNIVRYPDGHPGTRGWIQGKAACVRAPDSTPSDTQLSQSMDKACPALQDGGQAIASLFVHDVIQQTLCRSNQRMEPLA